jgi:uncharacterized repeat protein (TIGR03803 family)
MTKPGAWKTVAVVFALYLATGIAAPAQTFTTLFDFDGAHGATPAFMSLVQGFDGSLYGTTIAGGLFCNQPFGCGTVFKITRQGTLSVLYEFCRENACTDGSGPSVGLVLARDGNFYGTTGGGGANNWGTVFRITPDGDLITLYSFCSEAGCADGAEPEAALLEGIDGDLYGTTVRGGNVCGIEGCGTIFKITLHGTLTALHRFDGSDGSFPTAQLAQTIDGNLYGTTVNGGASSNCVGVGGCGTVFRMTPSGTLTTLHNFEYTDGAYPDGGVIQGAGGAFYGTTEAGIKGWGPGWGTIFEIAANGQFTLLQTFDEGGRTPLAGLVQGTDGSFFGTTLTSRSGDGDGTVFQFAPGHAIRTLHTFCLKTPCVDGAGPYGVLFQATDGNFYGTTSQAGDPNCARDGCGTLFRLSMGLEPFVILQRNWGRVDETGFVLGQGFNGATSVSLNGTPAKFHVVSDTHITATVPPGATTGFVTVVTPSGTLTSNVPFHVLP